jgi:hypothetical protein
MDRNQVLLRHFLAAIAYRTAKISLLSERPARLADCATTWIAPTGKRTAD